VGGIGGINQFRFGAEGFQWFDIGEVDDLETDEGHKGKDKNQAGDIGYVFDGNAGKGMDFFGGQFFTYCFFKK